MVFVLFLELPVEIQNKIWKIAANQEKQSLLIKRTQIPDIAWQPSASSPEYLWHEHYTIHYSKDVPAILQVSQHARAEAARYCQLMFAGVNGRALWFNTATDALEVRRRFLEHYPDHPASMELQDADSVTKDLAKVKSLIEYEDTRGQPTSNVARFERFQDLELLTIVAEWHAWRIDFVEFSLSDTIPPFWELTMNPKRIADGKQLNPAPSVEFTEGNFDI